MRTQPCQEQARRGYAVCVGHQFPGILIMMLKTAEQNLVQVSLMNRRSEEQHVLK